MAQPTVFQNLDSAARAAQDIAALVARLDGSLDEANLAVLIAELLPNPRHRPTVAEQLQDRPDLLTGAGAHGSATVITLIEHLRERGVAGVVSPACPFCDRVVRLTRGRDGLRCCMTCWNAAHTKACDGCGKTATMDRRTSDGRSLCAACSSTEASLLERCHGCGRNALVSRRDDEAVLCSNCAKPPTAVCSVCGRNKPCYQAETDAPRCKHCTDKSRAQECHECGKPSVVSRRTASGQPLCKACGSTDTCTGCGRRRPIRTRTAETALCQNCYKNDPSSHSTCQRCGTTGFLYRIRLCEDCAWPDLVRTLLCGTEGTMRPELEPVRAALSAVAPATGVNWAARAAHQSLLRQLAQLTGPVTHDVIGKLAPAGAAERLRTMLIQHGALPVRDELLISAERSVRGRIARVENTDDRKILTSFATWHHLRRLRQAAERRPLTQEQVTYSINALTAAGNLLNWLRHRGRSLATCTQSDIDEWLLEHDAFSRARGFVTWTVRRGHAHGIDIPRARNELVREVFDDHDQRWALARRLLTDDAVALPERVAGLLVLLYAQRVAKITRLTTGHVTITSASVEILLGDCPITVPPELGTLIGRLTAERTGDAGVEAGDGIWLFPGARRGQPASPRTLLPSLAALGVPATIGRNTALMELAAEMPAAVISGLLGIHLQRATVWTQDAGNTRPGYAAELARRNGARRTPSDVSGAAR